MLLHYSAENLNTVLNTKRNQLMYAYFSPLNNKKGGWKKPSKRIRSEVYTKFICMQKMIYFLISLPPFSQTALRKRVHCLGERLKTPKCKYLLKDVLQLITAILRYWLLTQVLVSSVEWQFLLKCGNRASYGT